MTSSLGNFPIIEFCEKYDIPWFPIFLNVYQNDDGTWSKELKQIKHETYDNKRPKQTDFATLTTEKIKARQEILKIEKFKNICEHIAMDTSKVHHIDIDVEDYDEGYDKIANNAPWFGSTTKSYGKHILIYDKAFIPTSKRMQFKNGENGGVELLCGQWSYCPIDVVLNNSDKDVFELTHLEKMLDYKSQKTKKIEIPVAQPVVEEVVEKSTYESVYFIGSNEYNEIKFYIENNCYREYCLTGKHIEWIQLGGMLMSVFSKEETFELWEKATLLNGSEDKKKEYKEQFISVKQIETDKEKAFKILVKWASKGNSEATTKYKKMKKDEEKAKKENDKIQKKNSQNQPIDIPLELIMWANAEEADFAKLYKTIIHKNTEIIFTGNEKELEGYLFNGIYYKPLTLHDSELHQKHFDVLFKNYQNGLMQIREQALNMCLTHHLNFYNFTKTKIDKLKTYNTRNNVIKIFKRDNYKDNIVWNKNENLFVFEDAIYDLEKGQFVKGNPDDFINYSCGLFYANKYTKEELDKATKTITEFIKSIVDEQNFKYIMILMASFLKQENKEELAHFWLGNGRNGKGTLAEILMKSLGNYWAELNIDNYTNYEKGKDRPNQNLFNCQNGRVLNTSEVGENMSTGLGVTFLSDNFKRYSGGDMITARELGTKRIAKFKAGKQLIQTNVMPTFSKMDNSLRQRIRVIPFPYTFLSEEDMIKEKGNPKIIAKLKNINLKKQLTDDLHRIAFTNMLFTYYKNYLKDGLIQTESIKKHTQSYFKSETLMNWVENNCEKKDTETISLEFIKLKFKEESGKTMSIKQIQDELSAIGCVTTRRNLNGWIYKQDVEDAKK